MIELTGCTECNVNSFTFLLNNHDLTMNLYMKKFIFDIFLLNIVMKSCFAFTKKIVSNFVTCSIMQESRLSAQKYTQVVKIEKP